MKKEGDIEQTFAVLVNGIREKRLTVPLTIIFYRSYEDVDHIYSFMKCSLGKEAVEPVGAPDMARCTQLAPKNVLKIPTQLYTDRFSSTRGSCHCGIWQGTR